MIIMKEFLFSIGFISLSTNWKLSIDIFIMSKLIKHAMPSTLSAAGRWSLATLKNKNFHLTNKKMLQTVF